MKLFSITNGRYKAHIIETVYESTVSIVASVVYATRQLVVLVIDFGVSTGQQRNDVTESICSAGILMVRQFVDGGMTSSSRTISRLTPGNCLFAGSPQEFCAGNERFWQTLLDRAHGDGNSANGFVQGNTGSEQILCLFVT